MMVSGKIPTCEHSVESALTSSNVARVRLLAGLNVTWADSIGSLTCKSLTCILSLL